MRIDRSDAGAFLFTRVEPGGSEQPCLVASTCRCPYAEARTAIEVGRYELILCDECIQRLRATTKALARAIQLEREDLNRTRNARAYQEREA